MEKNIGNGFIELGVKQEDLEESISALEELKHILQRQVMIGNGRNRKQGIIDSAEIGKHFDTAITSMKMLLCGFDDYKN